MPLHPLRALARAPQKQQPFQAPPSSNTRFFFGPAAGWPWPFPPALEPEAPLPALLLAPRVARPSSVPCG